MINMIFRLASAVPAGDWHVKFQGLNQRLTLLRQVRSERRQLKALDDRLLKDIGVTRAAALDEANRAYWDAPSARSPDRPSRNTPEPLTPKVSIRPLS